jgi:hypothetical protein
MYILCRSGEEAFRKQQIEAKNDDGKIILNFQLLTY